MKKKMLTFLFLLLIGFIFISPVYAETYNNYVSDVVSCGSGLIKNMPKSIPQLISIVYTIVQIAVPIVLVILGTLDLFKGITANKEEEMNKGRQIFIKRLIGAVVIFFVFAIVKIVVSLAAENNSSKIIDCTECFIHKNCD